MERETRSFAIEGLKIESRGEGKGHRLVGHAAVFNELSEDLGGFREQIAPGAFRDALAKRQPVSALFNHDNNFILGTLEAGTLIMAEDSRGLAVSLDMADTQRNRDWVLSPMERGELRGMSFGFSVRPGGQDWAVNDAGVKVRTLKNLNLFDVSIVDRPAYRQTDIAVRELRAWEATLVKPPVAPIRLLKARELEASL